MKTIMEAVDGSSVENTFGDDKANILVHDGPDIDLDQEPPSAT